MLCYSDSKTASHLLLLCDYTWLIWNSLFGEGRILGLPTLVEQLLSTSFMGFGKRKILWKCDIFAVLWGLWLEHNARIFTGRKLNV